jgi:hypothetical protein
MQKTITKIHFKLIRSFRRVKRDVVEMRATVRNQHKIINKLVDNERALLQRIRVLENQAEKKPKVITKTKTKVVKSRAKPTYVGAKTSMRLHDENCPFAKNIKRQNKVLFKSKVKPFNQGYKACTCLK